MRSFWFGLFCCCALGVAGAEPSPIFSAEDSLQRVEHDFELADGAAWDGRAGLFVPDVRARKLLLFNLRTPKAKPKVVHEGAAISGCFFQLGRLYVSDNGNSRIATLSDTGELQTVAQFEDSQRPNDLVVDVEGNVYVTFTREGVVRKISASDGDGHRKVETLVEKLTAPNGIALSPDGSTLYVSSVKTGEISKVELEHDGFPLPAKHFAQLMETRDGFRGDGMCIDRAGNLYVTGATAVSVFNPAGELVDQLQTPERPINVILGGVEGWTLYISTFGGLYQHRVNAYGVSPNPAPIRLDDAPQGTAVKSVAQELNVVYANVDGRKLLMDVFSPVTDHSRPRPAVVVVHGGGWAKGDKTKFRELAIRLARLGWVTAAIEYRLAFEAKFPAAIRDCNAATSYLRDHAERWNLDPRQIAAVGGSAGGHLVGLMAAGHDHSYLRHPGIETSPRLQAAVVMAGPLQITTGSVAERSHDLENKSNAVNWIGGTIDDQEKMYILADAHMKIDASTPPMLFLVGSLDTPERNQLSRDKLKKSGVATDVIVHRQAKHGHWNRPDWIGQVVSDIDQFLAEHLR